MSDIIEEVRAARASLQKAVNELAKLAKENVVQTRQMLLYSKVTIEYSKRIMHLASGKTVPLTHDLTDREIEVLRCIASGKANKQTADALSISIKTVEKHRQHVMEKCGFHETAGLTRFAIATGICDICDICDSKKQNEKASNLHGNRQRCPLLRDDGMGRSDSSNTPGIVGLHARR